MIDKVSITLRGYVRSGSGDDFSTLANQIDLSVNSGLLEGGYRLFGAGHLIGNRYQIDVLTSARPQTTISAGRLELTQLPGGGARLKLSLVLNPTRTLSHLLESHTMQEIGGLGPADFFRSADPPPARDVTLDRSDNMVGDMTALGGRAFLSRVEHYQAFLRTYEEALGAMLLDHLCPVSQGYSYVYVEDGGDIVATSGASEVRLEWGKLSVGQCEAYWERRVGDAVETMRGVANQALAAAREASVTPYDLLSRAMVERVENSLSVILPLASGDPVLAIYAKATNRVRFEVRYRKEVPQSVRGHMNGRPERLCDWFDAFRADAAPRVPWEGLQSLLEPVGAISVRSLLDLVDAVEWACEGHPDRRRGVLGNLLIDGGISATEAAGLAPETVIRRLVRRGVVEHTRLMRRELRAGGRRYRLTPGYAGLVGALGSSEVGGGA